MPITTSEFDTQNTPDVVCPYCGEKDTPDSACWADGGICECECCYCGREFAYEPEFSVSFCSRTMEEELKRKIKNTQRHLAFAEKRGNENDARIYAAQIDGLQKRLEALG